MTPKVLEEFWENKEEQAEVREFTHNILIETMKNLVEIDRFIRRAAEHWSMERMAVIDRNILRAATCELLYRSDIPSTVVINEAIEIAKKYSTEESASFINGILDRIAHEASAASGKAEQ